MAEPVDWTLLDRYFAGECSPEEAVEAERQIAGDPLVRQYVYHLRAEAGLESVSGGPWDTNLAWDRLKGTTRATAAAQGDPPLRLVGDTGPSRFVVRGRRTLVQLAAAIALVLGGLATWGVITRQRGAPQEVAMKEYVTSRGQRAETRLGDGTRVILGAESRLRVPEDFARSDRNVYLDGEAYFEVTHDSTRPFAVHARNGVARDLGTRFAVRAYGNEGQVQVVVAEGKVALGTRGVSATGPVLRRGELGRLDSSGTTHIRQGVDLERYLGWTEGQIVFRGTPLRDAVVDIGRWYDVEVHLAAPSIGEELLNASFKDEPAAEVMRVVAAALDLQLAQEGSVFTLRQK